MQCLHNINAATKYIRPHKGNAVFGFGFWTLLNVSLSLSDKVIRGIRLRKFNCVIFYCACGFFICLYSFKAVRELWILISMANANLIDLTNWQVRQLNVTEVARILGVSVPTIWRWTKSGQLPQPKKYGASTTRWSGSEIAKHIEVAA